MDEEFAPGGDTRQDQRGTCPACGSGQVIHVVIGMPVLDEMTKAPPWVRFAGCVPSSDLDRWCEHCGHEWHS